MATASDTSAMRSRASEAEGQRGMFWQALAPRDECARCANSTHSSGQSRNSRWRRVRSIFAETIRAGSVPQTVAGQGGVVARWRVAESIDPPAQRLRLWETLKIVEEQHHQ